jgi:hypothetical protein
MAVITQNLIQNKAIAKNPEMGIKTNKKPPINKQKQFSIKQH